MVNLQEEYDQLNWNVNFLELILFKGNYRYTRLYKEIISKTRRIIKISSIN